MLNKINFVWEAQRGGPKRKRRATLAVPSEANPVPVVGPAKISSTTHVDIDVNTYEGLSGVLCASFPHAIGFPGSMGYAFQHPPPPHVFQQQPTQAIAPNLPPSNLLGFASLPSHPEVPGGDQQLPSSSLQWEQLPFGAF